MLLGAVVETLLLGDLPLSGNRHCEHETNTGIDDDGGG